MVLAIAKSAYESDINLKAIFLLGSPMTARIYGKPHPRMPEKLQGEIL